MTSPRTAVDPVQVRATFQEIGQTFLRPVLARSHEIIHMRYPAFPIKSTTHFPILYYRQRPAVKHGEAAAIFHGGGFLS